MSSVARADGSLCRKLSSCCTLADFSLYKGEVACPAQMELRQQEFGVRGPSGYQRHERERYASYQTSGADCSVS